MKLIIAGSRTFNNYPTLKKHIFDLFNELELSQKEIKEVEIISGTARGADQLGELFAEENNLLLHSFPADWDKYGKAAGFIRNKQMGNFADRLIAFWDGKSRGTFHMIEYMWHLNKPTHIIKF